MTMSPADLCVPDLTPLSSFKRQAPITPATPSKNPCMVRIAGAASRYRNDPYGCPVLPPLAHSAPAAPSTAAKLAPLPPAFQMVAGRRRVMRLKEEVARAAEFDSTYDQEEGFAAESTQNHAKWAFVRLKHEVLLYKLPFPVSEGDRVVMEGDRGENIGCVERLKYDAPPHPIQCAVLRHATPEDLQVLALQREREEQAKHFSQGVADALQLNIKIVDTEFQADGNKLTVYFSSRRQIDFRRLQRQLFKQYRCRIWLVNWADVIKA